MRHLIALIILIMVIISCTRKNVPTVDKLVIVGIGNNLTYDSLGKPQLSLRTYVEFNKSSELKIALGDYKYVLEKKAPLYSLDKFYLLENVDTIKQLIERALINKTYDSLYIDKGEGVFYALIYQIADSTRQIIYKPKYLPKDLYFLDSLLRSKINSNKLVKTKPFSVDRLLPEFEKHLFKIHPPPPPPMVIDSIKFSEF
ncbi:MAG: hypothetical protein Q8928_12400 [Bacteroidota bacterium]|nr:hypothetical protein [Bacteroidota bacterium]